MATTLIVEDGTGIANANTYVSLADAVSYLTMRGYTVPADAVLTSQLILAMDYLSLQDWIGVREFDTQSLDWPRIQQQYCRCVESVPVGIPQNLKNAQCRLTVDIAQIGDLMPTSSGAFVTMEKVDVIETHYSEKINTDASPYFPMVDSLLSSLVSSGPGLTLTTRRV